MGRWLESVDEGGVGREVEEEGEAERQRMRDVAVVQFAGSLLKRTLSESFVGVALESSDHVAGDHAEEKSNKVAMAARSLSLELARHKHKLAAQLV